MLPYQANFFLITLSVIIIASIVVYAARRKNVIGSTEYALMTFFTLIFNIASLVEITTNQPSQMLFWRNVAQIGNFLAPVAAVYFALTFTGQPIKVRYYVSALAIIPLTALFFFFSPQYTYLVRESITVTETAGYPELFITNTTLGMIFISYCYILMILAITILLCVPMAGKFKNQARIIALGMFLIILPIWLKVFGFGITLNMSLLFMPGSLVMLWGLFKQELLSVSPIARDKVFEEIHEGIVVTTSHGQVIDLNPYSINFFKQLLGITALTESRGKQGSRDDFYRAAGEVISGCFPEWHRSIKEGETANVEISTDSGHDNRHYLISVYPLQQSAFKNPGAVSILRDITSEKAEIKHLTIRAQRDGLTGLYNHSFFKEAVQKEADRARRYNKVFSVIILDLDSFKEINDRFGHPAGDRLLSLVAAKLQTGFRAADIVARYGGDEFAVLLPETSGTAAISMVQKIVDQLAVSTFKVNDQLIKITASAGLASFPLSSDSAADIVNAADRNLYRAKKEGRNMVIASTSEDGRPNPAEESFTF